MVIRSGAKARVLHSVGAATAVEAACAREGRSDVWDRVFGIMSQELLLPWLRGDRGFEANCLGNALQRFSPTVVEDALRELHVSAEQRLSRSRSRDDVLSTSRCFFSRAREDVFVKPMLRCLGYKDAFDEESYFVKADGSLYVRGTQEPFPADGPMTKYGALFDPRSCFDGIRWDFLVAADPHMQVRSFRQKLVNLFEDQETIDPTEVAELDEFLEALRQLDTMHIGECLSSATCRRAWPAYVKALQNVNYWLDAQELLLCLLSRRSIAIFLNTAGTLRLVAAHVHGASPPVSVTIANHRGHFQRLCGGGFGQPPRRTAPSPQPKPTRKPKPKSECRSAIRDRDEEGPKPKPNAEPKPESATASANCMMKLWSKGLGVDQKVPGKAADAHSDEGSSTSEDVHEPDVMSDDDGETLQLDFAVEAHKTWTTVEDEDMDRIERLASELRDRPLLPPMPDDASKPWQECTSGIAFPTCHCAVQNCGWVSHRMPCQMRNPDSQVWVGQEGHWKLLDPCDLTKSGGIGCCGDAACLRQHLADAHRDVFAGACGTAVVRREYSFYLEAIAFKEQQTMPLVGASVDRRTFQHIAADLSEDAVRAMVCMCCARVATSMNGCTGIAMIKAKDYFEYISSMSWDLNWSFLYYISRFARDGSPLADHPDLAEDSWTWRRHLTCSRFKGLNILCCPEDVRCAFDHAQHLLCEYCRIPLCKECFQISRRK